MMLNYITVTVTLRRQKLLNFIRNVTQLFDIKLLLIILGLGTCETQLL